MRVKLLSVAVCAVAGSFSSGALAQSASQEPAMNVGVPVTVAPVATAPSLSSTRTLPGGTIVVLTPLQEISSKHVEVGEQYQFQVVNDVVEAGNVVIPRGSIATGLIKWKTGRAIGGKSGKFEIAFQNVAANGHNFPLTGIHRQEGRGNTVGALLGSILISGRSAVMLPGQMVNALVKEPTSY